MVSVRDTIAEAAPEAFGKVLAEDVVRVGVCPAELCRSRAEMLEMLADQVLPVREGLVTEARAYPSRAAALGAVEERPW